MRLLARTAKNVDTTSLPKKRNAASAAGGPPPGPENRPIGQGTPPRAQRRGWEAATGLRFSHTSMSAMSRNL